MDALSTADLCDEFDDKVDVAEPLFQDYGGNHSFFHGQIVTLKVFEDNSLVRSALETAGDNRVLVVDGGGSMRCALVGGNLAKLAYENQWVGIVVNGCIRDSAEIAEISIAVKALATSPKKSVKKGVGDSNVAVKFAGIEFCPGDYLYADRDGLLVAKENLLEPSLDGSREQ